MSLNKEMAKIIRMIPKKEKYLITGYMRLNCDIYIPYSVMQLCMLFTIMVEKWDEIHRGGQIETFGSKDQICRRYTLTNSDKMQSIFGCVTVLYGQHHWKYQLLRYVEYNEYHQYIPSLMIGIIKSNFCDYSKICNSDIIKANDISYGFIIDEQVITKEKTATITKTNTKFTANVKTIIDLYLNLNERTLKLTLNGCQFGIDYTNIDLVEYKMAVSLSGNGTAIKLIQYTANYST